MKNLLRNRIEKPLKVTIMTMIVVAQTMILIQRMVIWRAVSFSRSTVNKIAAHRRQNSYLSKSNSNLNNLQRSMNSSSRIPHTLINRPEMVPQRRELRTNTWVTCHESQQIMTLKTTQWVTRRRKKKINAKFMCQREEEVGEKILFQFKMLTIVWLITAPLTTLSHFRSLVADLDCQDSCKLTLGPLMQVVASPSSWLVILINPFRNLIWTLLQLKVVFHVHQLVQNTIQII